MKPKARAGARRDAAPGKRPEAQPLRGEGPGKGAALWQLVLAGVLVLAFYGGLRIGVGEPWGYDDYYHLGVTRELLNRFPLRAFPWTPFSVLAERFVDKEPLFHILLMPVAGLPVHTAALVGAMMGLAFLTGSMAWFLRSQRVPGAAGWLLGLAALGPFFVLRVEQLRPHVWMLGFCVLVLGLLLMRARPWILALVCALFGLTHTAGWVAIPFALVWSLAGRFAPAGPSEGDREDRRFELQPVLAAAGGWLLGQLVHPNLPHNFWLVWVVNAIVPLASTGAATQSLREALGVELQRPSVLFLLEQWPLFIAPVLAAARLVRRPQARTRAALTLVSLTVAFLLVGALQLRRLIEIGGVLGLLALAMVVAEEVRRGERPPLLVRSRPLAAGVLALALAWTFVQVRDLGRGDLRPLGAGRPLAMARFLGENGQDGSLVYTAQWADSAPLFYAAPRLKSLVILDPTFFYAKDPRLFDRYWAIAHGRSGDPVGEIGRRFGARYVTIWKAPGFKPLALQLRRDRRAWMVYEDRFYEIWELAVARGAVPDL
jgi:hypothetical protein